MLPMLKEEIMHEIGDAAVQTLERLKALGERLRGTRDDTTGVVVSGSQAARNHISYLLVCLGFCNTARHFQHDTEQHYTLF